LKYSVVAILTVLIFVVVTEVALVVVGKGGGIAATNIQMLTSVTHHLTTQYQHRSYKHTVHMSNKPNTTSK